MCSDIRKKKETIIKKHGSMYIQKKMSLVPQAVLFIIHFYAQSIIFYVILDKSNKKMFFFLIYLIKIHIKIVCQRLLKKRGTLLCVFIMDKTPEE